MSEVIERQTTPSIDIRNEIIKVTYLFIHKINVSKAYHLI